MGPGKGTSGYGLRVPSPPGGSTGWVWLLRALMPVKVLQPGSETLGAL